MIDFFRTVIWFGYFFGYMILHYDKLKEAEAARAAGDWETVRRYTDLHVDHWCRALLRLAGVKVTVKGRENLPQGPAVYVANHRSYYDIPLVLTCLDRPNGILAKAETKKIPLVNRWMDLLGCVYVERGDLRASVKALNDATAWVKAGNSFVIFPEGTRNKGEEGSALEFKPGAFRVALKSGAPVVPVAISHSRDIMENNHMLMHPAQVQVTILPPISLEGMDKEAQRELPQQVRQRILEALHEKSL